MTPTPASASERGEKPVVLMALAVALHALPLLAGAPLLDPDEGLHAAIAREMVARGDWLVPRVFGVPFLDKPILFFWALAAAIATLGTNELAIRLPGSLLGLAGAATTGLLARELIGRRAFAPAVFIASTLVAPFSVLLAPVHDIALVPFTNLTLWAFARRERSSSGALWLAAAGLVLGLAMLTKGLSGVALAGLAWAGYVTVGPGLSWRRVGEGTSVLLLASVVAAPWYLLIERESPGYLQYFFVQRHFMGFATNTQNHGFQPWWFYLPILGLGSLPWTAWLPGALASAFREWKHTAAPPMAVALPVCWLVLNVLFLSVAGSKLFTYVLPTFPALALLIVGRLIASEESPPRARRTLVHWLEGGSVAALPIIAVVVALVAQPALPPSYLWTGAIASPLVFAAWMAATSRKPGSRALWRRGLVVALVYAAVVAGLYRPVAESHSARALAEHFNEGGRLPRRLFIFDERLGSLLFYLSPKLASEVDPERIQAMNFGELRAAARTMVQGDVVAVPSAALSLVGRSLPTDSIAFVPVGDRYRLFSAPELLRIPPAPAPPQ